MYKSIIILLVVLFLSFVVYNFSKLFLEKSNSQNNDSEDSFEDLHRNRIKKQEDSIYSLNLNSRLKGISHLTNVELAIDKCIELHNQMKMMTNEEFALMINVPGDFERLIENHLPDFINKFAAIKDKQPEIASFNETIKKLIVDIDSSLVSIRDKKFEDFARKNRFMEIRFS